MSTWLKKKIELEKDNSRETLLKQSVLLRQKVPGGYPCLSCLTNITSRPQQQENMRGILEQEPG